MFRNCLSLFPQLHQEAVVLPTGLGVPRKSFTAAAWFFKHKYSSPDFYHRVKSSPFSDHIAMNNSRAVPVHPPILILFHGT